MMHDGWGVGGWWMFVALLFAIAMWGTFAWAAFGNVRDNRVGRSTAAAQVAQSPAIAILDERFARGEIDVDEYAARRQTLLTR